MISISETGTQMKQPHDLSLGNQRNAEVIHGRHDLDVAAENSPARFRRSHMGLSLSQTPTIIMSNRLFVNLISTPDHGYIQNRVRILEYAQETGIGLKQLLHKMADDVVGLFTDIAHLKQIKHLIELSYFITSLFELFVGLLQALFRTLSFRNVQ